MASYYSNYNCEIGSMVCGNEWEQQYYSASYDSRSSCELGYCEVMDVGYDSSYGEAPITENFSPYRMAPYSESNDDGNREYVHDYVGDYSIPAMSSKQYDEHKIDCEHANLEHTSSYAATEINGYYYDDCVDDVGFEHSTVIQPTVLYESHIAAQRDLDSKLELCVKEHDNLIRDMNFAMQRFKKIIKEEKRKKMVAPLPCLEKSRLESDVVVTEKQTPAEIEVNLVDDATGMGDNKRLTGPDIELVVTSQGKVDKTEHSVGLKNAMRCLEIQRKFWAIGSSFSVIPGVPLHQFEDPFLVGMRRDDVVSTAYVMALLQGDFSGDLSHDLGLLGSLDKSASKVIGVVPFCETSIPLRGIFLASCMKHLKKGWIDTSLGAWNALWRPPDRVSKFGFELRRPPDIRARMYDSFFRLLVLGGSWFGIWRPPDLICRYWMLGSNMLGVWFDKGRPPDIWVVPRIHRVASRTKPFKRDGLMHF